jgi:hypothetical protein
MRDGLAVSIFGHAALLVWGVFNLSAPKPIDASSIEAIPINFIQIEDVTSVPKGVAVAKAVEEPPPEPVKQQAEEPPPLPKPDPEPTPPPPDPTPIPPQPPEPEPLPPEPEPLPPEDTPPPEPEPPAPAPEPQPEAPPPEPEPPPPPPPEQPPAIQPKPANVPLPKARPHFTPPPQVAQKPKDKFDPDQIAALLDKDQTPPAAKQPEPALGGTSGTNDPQMTANELDALRARLGKCWSPPIGWTDPAEVRVVVVLSLNPDGTVNGDPQVLEGPQGRYAQAAPESALRAVRRCAPYTLPPEKYESWKQVKVTFDPTDMGGA